LPKGKKYSGPISEKAIGERLRQLRLRRGLTQVEVAEKLGIDQTLVSDYELGVVRLHGALIVGFAKVLKASADEILGLERSRNNGLPRDRRFLRRLDKIDKLTKRDKDALIRNLDNFLKGAGVD